MGSHTAIRKKDLLIHTTAFLNLKCIRLSEISQSQKTTYFIIPLISHPSQRQNYEGLKIEAGDRVVSCWLSGAWLNFGGWNFFRISLYIRIIVTVSWLYAFFKTLRTLQWKGKFCCMQILPWLKKMKKGKHISLIPEYSRLIVIIKSEPVT